MRPYVKLHPHIWNKRLSVREFTANNAINVSTCYNSFYLNVGEDIALLENLLVPPRSTSNQAAQEAIDQMNEALNDAKLNFIKAQERTKTQMDKTKRAEECKIGDWVFLSMQHLRTFVVHLSPKLR